VRLSTKGRYAVMAMVDLARYGNDRPVCLADIAERQEISLSYLEQLFAKLRRGGLVKSQPVRTKRGRPVLQFSLTERADSVFPKRYGQLATMVLQEVQEMGGPDALDEVFARVAQRHASAIEKDLEGLEFDAKMQRVVAWIGRAGTLAEQTPTAEGMKVTIHNCPFRNTALKFPQVCTITPQLISRLTGAAVSQAESIHRHDPYCSFVVHRPTGS